MRFHLPPFHFQLPHEYALATTLPRQPMGFVFALDVDIDVHDR
jgi:hypothetical protein